MNWWVDLHNEFASKNGWPTMRPPKGARLTKLRVRLRETPDPATWRTVYQRVQGWEWLREAKWRPTVAFMLRPDTVDRALEGEFGVPGASPPNGYDPQGDAARSETARVLREQHEAQANAVSEEERKAAMEKLRGVIGDTS